MQNMDALDAQVIETSANKPEATEDPTSNDFVTKEKYSKLKQRFKSLREVSSRIKKHLWHNFNFKLSPNPRNLLKLSYFIQTCQRVEISRLNHG